MNVLDMFQMMIFFKSMCVKNINSNLKIINIKRETENKNYGLRVILEEFYTEDLKNIGIFKSSRVKRFKISKI